MFSALVETIYRATRKGGENTGEDGRKWKLLVRNQNELFSQPWVTHCAFNCFSVYIQNVIFFSLLQCTKMPLSIYLECDTKESLAVAHTFELVCFRSLTDQVWRSGRTLPALPLDKQLVLMLSMSPWDEPLPPTGAHLSFPRESQTRRESISPTPLPRTDVFLHLCLSKNDAESVASNTCRSHRTTVIL